MLKLNGTLIFKWSDIDIKVNEILKLTDQKPLFGHKSGRLNKTHWICFMKDEVEKMKVKEYKITDLDRKKSN